MPEVAPVYLKVVSRFLRYAFSGWCTPLVATRWLKCALGGLKVAEVCSRYLCYACEGFCVVEGHELSKNMPVVGLN
jgi:hypothetical protein